MGKKEKKKNHAGRAKWNRHFGELSGILCEVTVHLRSG